MDKLIRKILWCGRRERFDIDYFEILLPSRTVSSKERYKSGEYYSKKCDRFIQYESGLELSFIEKLEASKKVRFYWEQPARIPFWRGKIKAGYYPDFGIYLTTGEIVIAEVKPLSEMLDHRVQAKAEGLMDFCSRKGFGMLLTDGVHTPDHLAKGKVNRKLEKELKESLKIGPIRKQQCQEIMTSCDATYNELYRAIIRLDLKFKPFPFKLQYGNQSPVYRQVYIEKRVYCEIGFENINLY